MCWIIYAEPGRGGGECPRPVLGKVRGQQHSMKWFYFNKIPIQRLLCLSPGKQFHSIGKSPLLVIFINKALLGGGPRRFIHALLVPAFKPTDHFPRNPAAPCQCQFMSCIPTSCCFCVHRDIKIPHPSAAALYWPGLDFPGFLGDRSSPGLIDKTTTTTKRLRGRRIARNVCASSLSYIPLFAVVRDAAGRGGPGLVLSPPHNAPDTLAPESRRDLEKADEIECCWTLYEEGTVCN